MKHHRICRFLALGCALLAASTYESELRGQETGSLRTEPAGEAAVGVRTLPTLRPAFGTVVQFGIEGPAQLRRARHAQIERFPLAPGREVVLDLQRFWVTDANSQFVAGTDSGDVALPPPDVALFKGQVRGEAGSRVFLSVHADGADGFISSGGREYVISRLDAQRYGVPADSQLVYARAETKPFVPPAAFDCEAIVPPGEKPVEAKQIVTTTASATTAPRVAQVAFECDYEFRQLFTSMTAASNYVAELVGAVSTIYERDINMQLTASYVRVWDTASDPYSSTSTSGSLVELRDYWNANMASVSRNMVHMLSGKRSGGGVAYVRQMCGGPYAYGVSGNLYGHFPTPIHDADYNNWDLIVVAHELGHNFSSPHTHCYDPPVDTCYNGDSSCYTGPTTCSQGTLMSYCHLCGGLDNIDLTFGPIVTSYIQSNLQACIGTATVSSLVYVDWRNNGAESGSLASPFNTVTEGISHVASDGTLSIASGSYGEALNISESVVLTATGGTVAIGQ